MTDAASRRARAAERRLVLKYIASLEEAIALAQSWNSPELRGEQGLLLKGVAEVLHEGYVSGLKHKQVEALKLLVLEAGVRALRSAYRADKVTNDPWRARARRWLDVWKSLPEGTSERKKAEVIGRKEGANPETVRAAIRRLRKRNARRFG
jgi:hypothetical protein